MKTRTSIYHSTLAFAYVLLVAVIFCGCGNETTKQETVMVEENMGRIIYEYGWNTKVRVFEVEATNEEGGILAHETATYTYDEAHFLFFGKSFNQEHDPNVRYIKMHGRKIYEFALSNVPKAMKECLDKSGVDISQLKKILIHQANEKMDEAIIQRFYKLYDQQMPEGIMPMSIHELGNSSVATVPTLFDLLIKGKIKEQSINKGDVILFASVGAGMNINAIVYKM